MATATKPRRQVTPLRKKKPRPPPPRFKFLRRSLRVSQCLPPSSSIFLHCVMDLFGTIRSSATAPRDPGLGDLIVMRPQSALLLPTRHFRQLSDRSRLGWRDALLVPFLRRRDACARLPTRIPARGADLSRRCDRRGSQRVPIRHLAQSRGVGCMDGRTIGCDRLHVSVADGRAVMAPKRILVRVAGGPRACCSHFCPRKWQSPDCFSFRPWIGSAIGAYAGTGTSRC